MAILEHIPASVKDYLDRHDMPYEVIHHVRDYTALESAAHTHTPGRAFAKVVVIRAGKQCALALLPAHKRVDLGKLSQALGGEPVALADESEIRQFFPDCELGAEPPLGGLYQLPVVACPELEQDDTITFNAGTHEEVIRMRYADFKALVQPQVLDFCEKVE